MHFPKSFECSVINFEGDILKFIIKVKHFPKTNFFLSKFTVKLLLPKQIKYFLGFILLLPLSEKVENNNCNKS